MEKLKKPFHIFLWIYIVITHGKVKKKFMRKHFIKL